MSDTEPNEWGAAPAPAPPPVPTPPQQPADGGPPGPVPPRPSPPGARPTRTRRRRRIWPWILVGMVVFLIGVGACTAVAVTLASAPVGAANDFVALLDEGELEAAYESMCPTLRTQTSFEEFQADMARSTEIDGYTLSSVSAGTGRPTLVSGRIRLGGTLRNVAFQMVQVDDEWRVCSYDRLN